MLNQIVPVSSPMHSAMTEAAPANVVALPSEVGTATGPRLGMSQMPPILSLPETSSLEYGQDDFNSTSPQLSNITGKLNSETASPTQAVVVTIPDNDIESSDDITIQPYEMAPSSEPVAMESQCQVRQEISSESSSISQSVPMEVSKFDANPTPMSSEVESVQETEDDEAKLAEVWRDETR